MKTSRIQCLKSGLKRGVVFPICVSQFDQAIRWQAGKQKTSVQSASAPHSGGDSVASRC